MYRSLAFLMLTLAGSSCLAQLRPTPRVFQKVENPTMVIDDRGSPLEILPTKRAIPRMSRSGKQVVYHVFAKEASAAIGLEQLGVVFNHAMQVQGYINGEIVFK